MSSSLPASGYATPHSATSSSTSLPSTTVKTHSKSKPVNVFSNDGSFLERFQRSKQEEEDRRKAEEALAKKKQFADRFKKRGKRPPPPDSDSPRTVIDIDPDPNPTKRAKLGDAPQDPEYRNRPGGQAGRALKDPASSAVPLIK